MTLQIGPSSDAEHLVACLRSLGKPENVAGMARFGIDTSTALGISNPDMQKIARLAGKDHARAMALWDTGIREARALAILTADPKRLTRGEAWTWAQDFNSWEIVDMAADLFVEARLEPRLVAEFAADEREFVRRAAFAMIASAAVHLKQEPDETLLGFLPLIERHSQDPRNFVKKAVNWALRNIGKRSHACHDPALEMARRLADSSDRTARFIGKDAVRELTAEKTIARIKR